jgi:RNA polymerase sigma-70 factor (ECF subfamily)
MPDSGAQPEERIAEVLAQGRHDDALRLTLDAYGPELYGLLLAELRDADRAQEVFALFTEDLWKGMARLQVRTTMRAYCYAVARHAKFRFLAAVVKKERLGVPLSQADWQALVAQVRTGTEEYLRSSARTGIEALREGLLDEERTLLVLRIDRGLGFREIAEALSDPGSGEAALKSEEQRWRKRFQLVKDKLRKRARELGIVPRADDQD